MTTGERHLCDFKAGRSGSFFTALFEALFKANSENMAKLARGFPEEAMAVTRFRREGYWQALEQEYKAGGK